MLSGFELYPRWVPLSCPCYYSQIEGLRLHVVYITRYVIRIKKHLHNRIEIIEIESNRKEYESLLTPTFSTKISVTWGVKCEKL